MADDSPTQNQTESASSSADSSPRETQMEIPEIRLQQTSLPPPPPPPLPRMRIQIPYQRDSPLSAYTDDSFLSPSPATRQSRTALKDSNKSSPSDSNRMGHEQGQSQPPDYQPTYDYLRSLALHQQTRSARHTSPTSNTFLSPSSRTHNPSLYMPYSDSATSDDRHLSIITLSPLSPTGIRPSSPGEPPSYEELYLQHPCPNQQTRLLELVRELDNESNIAEEVCKFLMGLGFIILTVLVIGLIFNWGRNPAVQANTPARILGLPPAGTMAKVSIPRLGSMVKVGKFNTLCGGRCKLSA